MNDDESNFERDASIFSINTLMYVLLFIVPAITTGILLSLNTNWELTNVSIVSVAVLNASINSVIAYLTIRLDGKSNDTLDHLDVVIDTTEELDDTLQDANAKVTSFTTDLDEAKGIFQKVGVNLTELDLEPIAEVVEKLKENKDGLNEVLDNLREVDVTGYINQAKRIDWKQLLDAAEEILGFIQARNTPSEPVVSTQDIMQNISIGDRVPIQLEEDWPDEEEEYEPEWDDEEEDEVETYTPPPVSLIRNKTPSLKRR
jgi:hypothetical protein